jgi:hypothetical protein
VFEVKCPDLASNNFLLSQLVNQTEIISFAEVLPTMSEIFINVVNSHQPNKVAAAAQ